MNLTEMSAREVAGRMAQPELPVLDGRPMTAGQAARLNLEAEVAALSDGLAGMTLQEAYDAGQRIRYLTAVADMEAGQ